ncbi:hypothetical protein H5410_060169 [Solanum commersonii]|uniref:Uncharacterized protein n=1 Tax=Solanum commersonii TaxID=4109 RepID=A0A9J5W4C5_SOLCO|nr:hypothetical protein H5410_060169 [Solanum commersonii]
MSSIFDHPPTYIDNLVLPIDPWFPHTDSLVAAKLCHFECGGVALAESETQTSPTTVEAITTFLYKCVNTSNFMPSLLMQAVDQRGASNIALVPADLTGNAILPFVVSATNKEEMNLQRLVSELRKSKEKIQDMLKYIESEEFLCSKGI